MVNGDPLGRVHFEVLNSIVLKKMASAGSVSAATGLPLTDVGGAMTDLERAGLIVVVGEQALAGDGAEGRVVDFAAGCYAELRVDAEIARLAEPVRDRQPALPRRPRALAAGRRQAVAR